MIKLCNKIDEYRQYFSDRSIKILKIFKVETGYGVFLYHDEIIKYCSSSQCKKEVESFYVNHYDSFRKHYKNGAVNISSNVNNDTLLNMSQSSLFLCLSDRGIDRACKRGRLKKIKIDNRTFFRYEDLLDFKCYLDKRLLKRITKIGNADNMQTEKETEED